MSVNYRRLDIYKQIYYLLEYYYDQESNLCMS